MLFRPHSRFLSNADYRADVDGLRAIAVIVVILFHLQNTLLPGGYVGVDIFFVISGFLITQHIRREYEGSGFSLSRFYERRVRRLAPSLIVTLLLSTVAAVLMFSPTDLVDYAKSLVASVLFAANIHFYMSSGYFTDDVDTKPLLHVWSLGVEEQFYLVWPFLILMMMHYIFRVRKHAWVGLAVLAAISLAGAIYLGKANANAAFYLMPARFFEFLVGALLVWIPADALKRKPLSDMVFLAGLALIAYSVTSFTKQTPFPSYYALIPCIGAALVIQGGRHALLRFALSNRLVAYTGRISYELYLFHWPAIIFYKYLAFETLKPNDMAIIAGITVGLAIVTYHAISCPLRYGYKATLAQRHNFLIGWLACCILLLAPAFLMKVQRGWTWRIPAEARMLTGDPMEFHKLHYGGIGFKENEVVPMGAPNTPPQFILVGDSFAGHYAIALSEFLAANGKSALIFHINGCLIAPHVEVHNRGAIDAKCTPAFSKVMEVLNANPTLPVIYSESWGNYKERIMMRGGERVTFSADNNDDYYRFMIDTVDKVRQAVGPRRFIFVGVAPGVEEQKTITRCFRIPAYLPNKCEASIAIPEAQQFAGQEFNIPAAKYASEHPEITFMNPREAFCQNGYCSAIRDSKLFYSDYAHFSKEGAAIVATHFKDLLLSLHP